MKTALAFLLLTVTAFAAGCGSSANQSAQPASAATLPERPSNVLFGHIASMSRTDDGFEVKFDPAWWLSGVAAQRAALEDTGSGDVPNDHYIVDETHRLLTIPISADARITVVTHGDDGIGSIAISPAELVEIVNGRNPEHRPLFSAKLPFWLQLGEKYPNGAQGLDQQYQP